MSAPALAAIDHATSLYAQLAEELPADYVPILANSLHDLAMSLDTLAHALRNLAEVLRTLGQAEPANAAAAEADRLEATP